MQEASDIEALNIPFTAVILRGIEYGFAILGPYSV